MTTFRELAEAYPNKTVPMMIIENIKSKALQSQRALLIDVDELPAARQDFNRLPTQTPETVLAGEEMLDLEEVIRVAHAAGRSSIHAMEASDRIFGLLPPGRMRGKRYPKWQFVPGIAGQPLRRILSKLSVVDAWARYQFFASAYPQLGHLTPVEVLVGKAEQSDAMTDETRALLESPHDQRVRLIEELAEGFAHSS
jgi:hypothetical protein